MTRTISIIIPTFNSGHLIGQAIDSALAQTLSPAEIIVVDDGSTDDTRQRLELYVQRGVIYVHQSNAGVSAARNAGLGRCGGDLIAFLDADDVWHPRKLELQAEALQEHPELGMLGTSMFNWPLERPPASLNRDVAVREVPWSRLAVKNYFTTSSIMLRRPALDSVGPISFDTELQGPEDYDLWLRIAEKWAVGNLPLPLTGYRSHLAGLGSQPVSMEAGMERILQKLGDRGAWDRPGGRLLRRKAHAYWRYSCALMYTAAGRQPSALARIARSLLNYPLCFRSDEIRTPCGRARLLAVILLRLLKLKPPIRAEQVLLIAGS